MLARPDPKRQVRIRGRKMAATLGQQLSGRVTAEVDMF